MTGAGTSRPCGDTAPGKAGGGRGPVVAICGGIGGAKLALGLYRVLEPGALSVIVNTGDDFSHLGLHVSPDIDTVTYTLAGKNNPGTGWGRADETWSFMSALAELGGETWFSLGDKDLALNLERTRRLSHGETLSAITQSFCRRFGITATLLPMSDDPVRTRVETTEGVLPFQHYFVREKCRPVVRAIYFEGAGDASPCAGVVEALGRKAPRAVIICPSNPYLSIDPILAVPGIRQAIERCAAPVIAVSPLIGGRAVKGPTAKIMAELSIPAGVGAIAEHYGELLGGFVIDETDVDEAGTLPVPCLATRTLMKTLNDRDNLASETLFFADRLRDQSSSGAIRTIARS